MRKKVDKILEKVTPRLKKWARSVKAKASALSAKKPKLKKLGGSLRKKVPNKFRNIDFENINLKNISEYSTAIRWGLIILAVFLIAQITSGIIGLFIRPTFPKIPKKVTQTRKTHYPGSDIAAIEQRNIFNVLGTIPEPFETGQLECMNQAKKTNQPLELLGTIVMDVDRYSTALIQEKTNPVKIAVRKDEFFGGGKYLAMSIHRKKLCFQVQSSQEMEYVEIPEKEGSISSTPSLITGSSRGGIKPVSSSKYEITRNFLDDKLLDLNNILQTARAVPYLEPGTGQFKGFLVQTIDPDSPFAELGIRQGDILTGVNEIELNNAGKGLEAFQQLRNSNIIDLHIIRGGRKTSLNYSVK